MSILSAVLVNVLLVCASLVMLSWVLVGVQTFFNDRRHEKRQQEAAQRELEYHKQRMEKLGK